MRGVSVLVAVALSASPAYAQSPIRASIEKAVDAAAEQSKETRESDRKSTLFWSGLAVGIAGVTTSVLGLTAFRTEDSSTGNAPRGVYQACVAQKNTDPIYATNQCGGLKGKNLKLLWGGVALSGAGAALMIGGRHTSAELSPGAIAVFHHLQF
jgi:hypothetical protein